MIGLGMAARKVYLAVEPCDITLAPDLEPVTSGGSSSDGDSPKLELGVKAATPQSELSLDSTPRGHFKGESPNVFDGEDLDLPDEATDD